MLTENTVTGMMLLMAIAVAMLLWEWYENEKRERVCRNCNDCQRKIAGPPRDTGGPSARVGVGL